MTHSSDPAAQAVRRSLGAPEIKLVADDISRVDKDGSFTGYASLFDVADLSRDVIEKGAFIASLGRRGVDGVKMLYQHDPAEPIGRWTEIRETSEGLRVTGRLMTDLARGREVLSMMREGVLDGLSIGFRTVKSRTDRKSGIRRLLEIDLWEISVVTFPMQPDARVTGVKMRPPAERVSPAARAPARSAPVGRAQELDLAERVRRIAEGLGEPG